MKASHSYLQIQWPLLIVKDIKFGAATYRLFKVIWKIAFPAPQCLKLMYNCVICCGNQRKQKIYSTVTPYRHSSITANNVLFNFSFLCPADLWDFYHRQSIQFLESKKKDLIQLPPDKRNDVANNRKPLRPSAEKFIQFDCRSLKTDVFCCCYTIAQIRRIL